MPLIIALSSVDLLCVLRVFVACGVQYFFLPFYFLLCFVVVFCKKEIATAKNILGYWISFLFMPL
jgi:hypothetical protein